MKDTLKEEILKEFEKMRKFFHDCYNEGHNEEDTHDAFHHGMIVAFDGSIDFLSQAIDRVRKERDRDFIKTLIVEIEAHLPFGSDTFSNGRLTGMRDAIDIINSLSHKKGEEEC